MTAFQGVRVLEAARGIAGPMAAMMLGDFGAQVLKFEPPGGDPARHAAGYQTWNRNKAVLTIDPASASERTRLDSLLAEADVLVLDHAPGETTLGIDAATAAARHPRLVCLWTPPFGISGPWSGLPEHHAMLAGLTGAAFRQGGYADQPIWHVMPMILHGQAVVAAAAAAAALTDRHRTGLGQVVTVSGAHGAAEVAGPIGLLDSPGMGQGHPLGGSPTYRLYQCADGAWLFLATLFPHFFERAVEALDLRRRAAGAAAGMDLGGLLERTFRERPCADWLSVLAAYDVPAARVENREAWLDSPPMIDNGLRVELQHPRLGPVVMPGVPVKLSATPGAVQGLAREAGDADLRAFASPRAAEPAPTPGGASRAPLHGVTVLDLGTVIAGAYAGSILASFGADVIKVESAEGDPFRPFGPGFTNHNRGKRGLGLDLKAAAGREAFLDMARQADVVLDNYRLGVRERLGIGYPTLAAINPRIVSCSINAFGANGAAAHLPGFDPLLQARSGMMAAQGGAGEAPVFHSVAINDVATAAVAAFGVIAALHARETTGVGQNVETCLAAQSALFQSGALTTWPGAPAPPQGEPDCIGLTATERYYRCADGWITLAATTPRQAAAATLALIGADAAARFPDPLAEARRGPLATEIAAALRQRPRAEVLRSLAAVGAPAAPVFRDEAARGQAWLWDCGYFAVVEHPLWGEMVASRGYADFSRGGGGFGRLDPALGEHGLEVLRQFGFEMDRIRKLAAQGVIFRG